jgi:glucose/arabinose dehydrogenase
MQPARRQLTTRRTALMAALVALALALPAPTAGVPARPSSDGVDAPAAYDPNAVIVGWARVIGGGLSKPVYVTNAGDGSGRLFIVEQTGRIRIFKSNALLSTPYLNLSASISTGFEQGLLGLAFHPDYDTNGKFYVNLTQKDGTTAINEYRANPPSANTVDWHTGRRIMTIAQPYSNHNGGHLAFGPDGFLYIGTGDGGSGGDPGNRAQSLTQVLGKMLRIDINGTQGTWQYRAPADNPYVGIAGYDEIWARGLRNPWGWSFDRANGDLYIADVGQGRYEEVNISLGPKAGRGLNYGWRVMEGRHCYNPPTNCNTSGKVLPVEEYAHSVSGDDNCSVTGGYVYRGTFYPALVGGYFFGDYCSGRLWSMPARSVHPVTPVQHKMTTLSISGFGEDEAGNVFVVFHEGLVYRITGMPKP